MRHYYALFLTGLGLLTNLTACSPDTKSETRASRKSLPVTLSDTVITTPNAGSIGRVNPDADQQPTAEARPRRNTVLAPAGEALPEAAPTFPPLARRQLARLIRRQRRAATAAPAPTMPADTMRKAAFAASAPASPAASAADATPAPDDSPKKAQVFRIRPDRDTVLYGTEGTVMRIPAGTFVQGKDADVKDLVEIRLREFYSMADILLERLSTMAGPRLLETGGMVQLSAATADGRECKLKPGSEFELGFPATRPIEGMQLYNGQPTNGHGLNWKLAPQRKPTANNKPTVKQQWSKPHFKGGYAKARHRLSKDIVFDQTTAMRLNGYQAPGKLRRQLRREGHRAPLVGKVLASFELSETGQVNDVYFRNAGLADSALQAAVAQALRRMKASPTYLGERGRSRPTRSLMKVDVRFTADRRVLVDHLRWDRATTTALYKADVERKATGKGHLTDAQLQAAPLDAVTDELFKKRQNNAKRYTVGNLLGEQLNYVKELAVFRVQAVKSAVSLGTYNCDRPLAQRLLARVSNLTKSSNFRAPKGGLARLALVRLGLEHPTTQPADISLVLRDQRCVIRGDAIEGRVTFEQLADSTVATLVAIRRDQGQLYLGLRDVVVHQRVEPPLEFRLVTVAELRSAMARFDL